MDTHGKIGITQSDKWLFNIFIFSSFSIYSNSSFEKINLISLFNNIPVGWFGLCHNLTSVKLFFIKSYSSGTSDVKHLFSRNSNDRLWWYKIVSSGIKLSSLDDSIISFILNVFAIFIIGEIP